VTLKLVLASGSPSRLRLLKSVGIFPQVIVSKVDEEDKQFQNLNPGELVMALAILKAHTVAQSLSTQLKLNSANSPALVLGCDSTFEFNGKSLGKPETRELAIARAKELSGKSGILHTGHCLIDTVKNIEVSERSSAKVYFAKMTDSEIVDYVDSGEPLQVAGGFTLDGKSAPFINSIEGDPSTIIGLSLPLLRRMLIKLGYAWTEIKSANANG
jgi:septum formation protein